MDDSSMGEGATGRGLRIACWPRTDAHDYLRSFYLALEPHGVRLSVDGLPLEDAYLERERHQFDAIHLHWPEHFWGAGSHYGRFKRARIIIALWRFLRTARRLRIPFVWTVHNLAPHERGDWIDAVGYSMIAKLADVAVCHDEHTRREFVRRFRPKASAPLVMPLGNFRLIWPAPQNRDDIRSRMGIGADERVLICFGLWRAYKGFDLALS